MEHSFWAHLCVRFGLDRYRIAFYGAAMCCISSAPSWYPKAFHFSQWGFWGFMLQAFGALRTQTGRDPLSLDPAWGVLERCSAHAIHISMSLYGGLSPWIFLITAPAHSILNWSTVKLMSKIGILVVETLLFCASVALMGAALAIWGH
eukprot:symbB.v1.2.007200.t1/scaffold439.1/size205343/3